MGSANVCAGLGAIPVHAGVRIPPSACSSRSRTARRTPSRIVPTDDDSWRRTATSEPEPRCPSQLAFATLQPAFDFPQGMGAAQQAEQHRDKQAQTRQPLAAALRPRLLDDALKVGRGVSLSVWRNMLHDVFRLGPLRSGAGGFGDSPMPYTFG